MDTSVTGINSRMGILRDQFSQYSGFYIVNIKDRHGELHSSVVKLLGELGASFIWHGPLMDKVGILVQNSSVKYQDREMIITSGKLKVKAKRLIHWIKTGEDIRG